MITRIVINQRVHTLLSVSAPLLFPLIRLIISLPVLFLPGLLFTPFSTSAFSVDAPFHIILFLSHVFDLLLLSSVERRSSSDLLPKGPTCCKRPLPVWTHSVMFYCLWIEPRVFVVAVVHYVRGGWAVIIRRTSVARSCAAFRKLREHVPLVFWWRGQERSSHDVILAERPLWNHYVTKYSPFKGLSNIAFHTALVHPVQCDLCLSICV